MHLKHVDIILRVHMHKFVTKERCGTNCLKVASKPYISFRLVIPSSLLMKLNLSSLRGLVNISAN